jgi:hypothetical protein
MVPEMGKRNNDEGQGCKKPPVNAGTRKVNRLSIWHLTITSTIVIHTIRCLWIGGNAFCIRYAGDQIATVVNRTDDCRPADL